MPEFDLPIRSGLHEGHQLLEKEGNQLEAVLIFTSCLKVRGFLALLPRDLAETYLLLFLEHFEE